MNLGILDKKSFDEFKEKQVACIVGELIAIGWDIEKAELHAEWCSKQAQIQRILHNQDGVQIGWIEWSGYGRVLWFNYIFIEEKWRGFGYAADAIQTVIKNYKTQASVVQASNYTINESGRKVLERLGFKPIATSYQLGN